MSAGAAFDRDLAAATRSLVEGRLDDAEDAVAALLARAPRHAEVHMLGARLAAARGDRAGELAATRRAAELAPERGDYRAFLARCLARAQDPDGANASIAAALAAPPLSDLALDALAGALTQFGRHREAAELLARAVAEGSRNAAIHFNLGNNCKFTGDFEGARAAYTRAIALAPRFAKAHAALTSLGPAAEGGNLPRLEAAIRDTPDPREAIHLRHAAAKECEALGAYDAAWAHLTQGKRALAEAIQADPRAANAPVDRLLARLARYELPPAGPATGPIFVVGMPRSGTTVTDRILSNHDSVASIGESLYFAQLLKIATGSTSRDLLDDPVIGALGTDLREIGARYAERSHPAGAARFVDKFHLNILLAGHLMAALPDARIVCVIRDPLDTIVSNYRQLFEFDSHLYRYSLDIVAAAEFYVRFRRLADRWAQAAPDRFLTVRYEALVADPEAAARAMFAHCGLSWQPGCSAIERNTASVATASAVQVRTGIHARAVGQWRRYERHLDAASAVLAEAGFA